METADQEFTDRTADKGAGHQAEGSGSKGNGGGIRKAHAFQYRAEGTGGTVAADQGNGAVGQPHEGIFPEKREREMPMRFCMIMRMPTSRAILMTKSPPFRMRCMLAM